MKRTIALLSATLALCVSAQAQLNLGALQDGHNSGNAARHLPTFLGDHVGRAQVTLFNPYVSIGSSFATFRDARDYITSDKITNELIGNTINHLDPEDNNINGVVDVALLDV